jgi:hypothetical protein
MFILDPDPYSLPCYRIGPFTTRDLAKNSLLEDDDTIDEYFKTRFGQREITYTENGRRAINLALSYYKLCKDDTVTILTTSGNFYISGCVTKEIENFCCWSREMEPTTKLIFVNHEFGYPYQNLQALKKFGLPIIEDCANTFYSNDVNHSIGKVGDFVIYSFPKIFPLQVGGLLISNIDGYRSGFLLDEPLKRYIKNVLSKAVIEEATIKDKRLHNYKYLQTKFDSLGLLPRFKLDADTVPGVFMFKVNATLDLAQMKEYFYAHGIQCSVFYGERTFFIPCHQALEDTDLDYFAAVMENFLSKQK